MPTASWQGDVQPEKDTKDERLLGPHSHLAIDVYDNAMFVGAIDDFLHLCNATQHTPKVTTLLTVSPPALCTGLRPGRLHGHYGCGG